MSDLKKALLEAKKIVGEEEMSFFSFSTVDQTSMMCVDFPSRESGSSCVSVGHIGEIYKDLCWNNFNTISIYDQNNDIFQKELSGFFQFFEADGFSDEDNVKIREEIANWMKCLPDELSSVFQETVRKNIKKAIEFRKKQS